MKKARVRLVPDGFKKLQPEAGLWTSSFNHQFRRERLQAMLSNVVFSCVERDLLPSPPPNPLCLEATLVTAECV